MFFALATGLRRRATSLRIIASVSGGMSGPCSAGEKLALAATMAALAARIAACRLRDDGGQQPEFLVTARRSR